MYPRRSLTSLPGLEPVCHHFIPEESAVSPRSDSHCLPDESRSQPGGLEPMGSPPAGYCEYVPRLHVPTRQGIETTRLVLFGQCCQPPLGRSGVEGKLLNRSGRTRKQCSHQCRIRSPASNRPRTETVFAPFRVCGQCAARRLHNKRRPRMGFRHRCHRNDTSGQPRMTDRPLQCLHSTHGHPGWSPAHYRR